MCFLFPQPPCFLGKKALKINSVFDFEIIIDYHTVIRSNTERACIHFTWIPQRVPLGRPWCNIPAKLPTLRESEYATTAPEGTILMHFYNHTDFSPAFPPLLEFVVYFMVTTRMIYWGCHKNVHK